jgi:uncharacterized protein YjeT (DUF2065 family)
MAWFLYLISVVWLAVGACAILYTGALRRLARKVLQNANPTLMSVLPILGGMLMILSVSATSHPWVIGGIGGLGMLKGGLMVYNPNDWYTKATRWYLDEISDQTHRLFGILLLIFGTAMVSWIKP